MGRVGVGTLALGLGGEWEAVGLMEASETVEEKSLIAPSGEGVGLEVDAGGEAGENQRAGMFFEVEGKGPTMMVVRCFGLLVLGFGVENC